MTNLSLPGQPDMVPLSPRVHQALMGDLARIDDLFRRMDIAVTAPGAKSIAVAEEAVKTKVYAHHLAAAAIRAALDHLLAWRSVLQGGVMPTYAHMSLLRTAHESALLAYWLMEPGLDADTRHARGIAVQASDYDERHKFEDSIGLTTPPPKGKLAVDRLAELMDTADQLGFTHRNKKGIRVLKTTVPGTVELFDLYADTPTVGKGQWRYRLYSGYAHGKQWALIFGAQQMGPYTSSGHTIARVEAYDILAVDCTQACVDATERAVDAYEELRT